MQFTFNHTNLNVCDLEASLAFYKRALGLVPVREHKAEDGSFRLAFLSDGKSDYQLELTWLRDHPGPYALGENETHMCFTASDYEAAHALHQEMGCIVFKTRPWACISSRTPTGIGSKSFAPRRTRNPPAICSIHHYRTKHKEEQQCIIPC